MRADTWIHLHLAPLYLSAILITIITFLGKMAVSFSLSTFPSIFAVRRHRLCKNQGAIRKKKPQLLNWKSNLEIKDVLRDRFISVYVVPLHWAHFMMHATEKKLAVKKVMMVAGTFAISTCPPLPHSLTRASGKRWSRRKNKKCPSARVTNSDWCSGDLWMSTGSISHFTPPSGLSSKQTQKAISRLF